MCMDLGAAMQQHASKSQALQFFQALRINAYVGHYRYRSEQFHAS